MYNQEGLHQYSSTKFTTFHEGYLMMQNYSTHRFLPYCRINMHFHNRIQYPTQSHYFFIFYFSHTPSLNCLDISNIGIYDYCNVRTLCHVTTLFSRQDSTCLGYHKCLLAALPFFMVYNNAAWSVQIYRTRGVISHNIT